MPVPQIQDGHVPIHGAWEEAQRFLRRQLHDHFNAVKDELYAVTANGAGRKFTDDGIYLPDVQGYKLRAGPRPSELTRQIGDATLYVGPAASLEQRGSAYLYAGARDAFEAALPFGIAVAFDEAPQEQVTDPDIGELLDAEEIMNLRALRTLGALKHTLAEHCRHDPRCLRVAFTTDYSLAGTFSVVPVGSDDVEEASVALVYVEIDVEQRIYTPK